MDERWRKIRKVDHQWPHWRGCICVRVAWVQSPQKLQRGDPLFEYILERVVGAEWLSWRRAIHLSLPE